MERNQDISVLAPEDPSVDISRQQDVVISDPDDEEASRLQPQVITATAQAESPLTLDGYLVTATSDHCNSSASKLPSMEV